MDTTAETVVCPRHQSRTGRPIWCDTCTTDIHTALTDLPGLHAELADMYGTTPRRADRRGSGDAPPLLRREFGLADEIARALDMWARLWADHLSENPPETWNPLGVPVGIDDKPVGLYPNRGEFVWEQVRRARAYHDLQHGRAPRPLLKPRAAARYLNAHRGRIDILATPGAKPLGTHLLGLWHTATKAVPASSHTPPKPTRRRATGPCPGCEHATLYRTADSDRVRCDNCPQSLSEDEYRAYATALAAAHRGAA